MKGLNWSLALSEAPESVLDVQDVTGEFDHIRVANEEEHALIGRMVRAAEAAIEKEISRALLEQTWQLRLNRFPYCSAGIDYPGAIGLPRPTIGEGQSLTEVTGIQYVDTNGATQSLSASTWDENVYAQPVGYVYPAYGYSWPMTRDVPNAVTITYTVGLENADDVPDSVKVAISQLTASLYEHRESTITGTIVNDMPFLGRLLTGHRCFWEPAYA